MTHMLPLFLAAVMFIGCDGYEKLQTPTNPLSSKKEGAESLSPAESLPPKEVAKQFVEALDAGDEKTLASMVAVETAKRDVPNLYGPKENGLAMPNRSIARYVTMSWQAVYATLTPGSTRVIREDTVQDRATVRATGKTRQGAPLTFSIYLARDEGSWKVRPKLKIR